VSQLHEQLRGAATAEAVARRALCTVQRDAAAAEAAAEEERRRLALEAAECRLLTQVRVPIFTRPLARRPKGPGSSRGAWIPGRWLRKVANALHADGCPASSYGVEQGSMDPLAPGGG
jgi:hypothetical protein